MRTSHVAQFIVIAVCILSGSTALAQGSKTYPVTSYRITRYSSPVGEAAYVELINGATPVAYMHFQENPPQYGHHSTANDYVTKGFELKQFDAVVGVLRNERIESIYGSWDEQDRVTFFVLNGYSQPAFTSQSATVHESKENKLRSDTPADFKVFEVRDGVLRIKGDDSTLKADAQAEIEEPRYDDEGKLVPPSIEEYREWVFVGANLGLGYSDNAEAITKEEAARNKTDDSNPGDFHNVYINPSAFQEFVKTGKFPQKTMLVMDVFESKQKEPRNIVDRGHFPGTRKRIEIAVKNKDRPDGSTTDWAYYSFSDNMPRRAFPDRACYDCHKQHADTDNVWTQFYPVLRDK